MEQILNMVITSFSISKIIGDNIIKKNIPIGKHSSFFSMENSTGKTTLLRSLLYSLGFDIQGTHDVDFNEFIFNISLYDGEKNIDIKRTNAVLKIDDREFDLPAERRLAHSLIFKTTNINILDNILGTFFIDQDFGWTILGYGNYLQNNNFDLPSLLNGLNNFDDEGLKNEINEITKEIKKYKFIVQVYEKRKKYTATDSGEVMVENANTELNYLKSSLAFIDERIYKYNTDISNIESTLRKNKHFSAYISEMNLSVVDPLNGNTIPINESTLLGLKDLKETLSYRKLILQGEREKLKRERNLIVSKIPRYESLASVKTEAEKFFSEMSGININGMKTIVSQLENDRRKKQEKLKELESFKNDWVYSFLEHVKEFALFIGGLSDDFYSTNKYIYMKKRPQISGAIFHKASLCYHLAAVKVCEERLGICLPLIIDSPSGREVVEETLTKTLELISTYFPQNQVIFATIKNLDSLFSDAIIFNPQRKVFDF